MKCLVVIEPAGRNWSGWVPDHPGCVATGATPAETRDRLRDAVKMHVAGLRSDGDPVPHPTTVVEHVEV